MNDESKTEKLHITPKTFENEIIFQISFKGSSPFTVIKNYS